MPTEVEWYEVWLWAVTATFLLKGAVFLVLGWLIWREHTKAGQHPTSLGLRLMVLFALMTVASFSIGAVFGLTLWALREGANVLPANPPEVPSWVRWVARVTTIVAAWGVILSGMVVVRFVQSEAARRARMDGPDRMADATERLATATERIVDQGDETALARESGTERQNDD